MGNAKNVIMAVFPVQVKIIVLPVMMGSIWIIIYANNVNILVFYVPVWLNVLYVVIKDSHLLLVQVVEDNFLNMTDNAKKIVLRDIMENNQIIHVNSVMIPVLIVKVENILVLFAPIWRFFMKENALIVMKFLEWSNILTIL